MTNTTHYYLGLGKNNLRELFQSSACPTEELCGQRYLAVIGPFRTKRGAIFMRDHGKGNPHCQCVADAERISKARKNTERSIAKVQASYVKPSSLYFALNRKLNTACVLSGFTCWEQVQGAFHVGIKMPDGQLANGIGHCKDYAEFERKAIAGRTTIICEPVKPNLYPCLWCQARTTQEYGLCADCLNRVQAESP